MRPASRSLPSLSFLRLAARLRVVALLAAGTSLASAGACSSDEAAGAPSPSPDAAPPSEDAGASGDAAAADARVTGPRGLVVVFTDYGGPAPAHNASASFVAEPVPPEVLGACSYVPARPGDAGMDADGGADVQRLSAGRVTLTGQMLPRPPSDGGLEPVTATLEPPGYDPRTVLDVFEARRFTDGTSVEVSAEGGEIPAFRTRVDLGLVTLFAQGSLVPSNGGFEGTLVPAERARTEDLVLPLERNEMGLVAQVTSTPGAGVALCRAERGAAALRVPKEVLARFGSATSLQLAFLGGSFREVAAGSATVEVLVGPYPYIEAEGRRRVTSVKVPLR